MNNDEIINKLQNALTELYLLPEHLLEIGEFADYINSAMSNIEDGIEKVKRSANELDPVNAQ